MQVFARQDTSGASVLHDGVIWVWVLIQKEMVLWEEELANTARAFPTDQGSSHIGPVDKLMAST